MENLYTQNSQFDKNILTQYFVAGTQDVPANRLLTPQQRLLNVLEQALKQGITCFQLREKGSNSLNDNALKNNTLNSKEAIKKLAIDCKTLCHKYKVPFFINDDVALALEVKADGIHVGQNDMAITDVINKCKNTMWVGLSINTLAQAQMARAIDGINYYGVGALYPTNSKSDATQVGLTLLKNIRKQGITKPIVGIGGINFNNSEQVLKAGADGVAMISAIINNIK